MTDIQPLPTIGIADLARDPGAALARVARGERFVVTRYGRAVATLQPLNGVVVQPFDGRDHDVYGLTTGDVNSEIAKLTEVQRLLLAHADPRLRGSIKATRIDRDGRTDMRRELQDLVVRGLVRKAEVGHLLSGRGWMLREALLERAGLDPSKPAIGLSTLP